MQLRFLLIVPAFYIAGCSSNSSKQSTTTIDTLADGTIVERKTEEGPGKTEDQANGFWEKLVMVEIRDGNGAIAAIRPLPSSWQIGNSITTGPHGISIKSFPLRIFMDNYNPSLQQSYVQSGQQLRSMPGVEQLIQEDFVPWAQNQGMQLVNFYEIPEISKMDKWYSEQLYAALPARSDVAAFGINWKKDDGSPYFQILHLNVKTSNTMQNWSYYVDGVEAEAEYMESAKKQLIFGLANTRFNLEPIAKYNREEAQRCGQSWAAHNQRMAQNQANFEAQQRAFVNKSNAINDAIMSGWRERNAASDKNQERFIDGIYERTNVVDPNTGQGYKVAAGANQYWMNSNGEYIGTQIQNYNPNLDDNMNQVKWQELKQRKN